MSPELLQGTVYAEMWGEHDGGSIDLHGSSGSVRRTEDDDIWRAGREEEFGSAAMALWPTLIEIFCLLGGWNRSDVVISRVRVIACASSINKSKSYEASRRVVTSKRPSGVAWSAFSAYLGLRDYSMEGRGADYDVFELSFDAYRMVEDKREELKNDPAVLSKLDELRPALLKPLTELVENIIDERVTLKLLPATWHSEGRYRPYRILVVIMDGDGGM